MRAVVIGATGLVGGALVRELVAAGHETTALARREGAPGASWRIVEMAALSAQDVPDADAAFCCLGTTIRTAGSQEAFRAVDHALVLRFARACRERGIPQLHVVSSMGADPASRAFYARVKGEMERDVQALGFPTLRLYRPSLLLGERAESRPAERVGIAAARILGPVIPARYRGIRAEVVARAMAREAAAGSTGARVLRSDEIARIGA